jgi:hypothetical protein
MIPNKQKVAFFLFVLFLHPLAALAQAKNTPEPQTQFPAADAFANSKTSFKIVNALNKTFGYTILADGQLLTHQPSVSGTPGNQRFISSLSTQNVAEYSKNKKRRNALNHFEKRNAKLKTLK